VTIDSRKTAISMVSSFSWSASVVRVGSDADGCLSSPICPAAHRAVRRRTTDQGPPARDPALGSAPGLLLPFVFWGWLTYLPRDVLLKAKPSSHCASVIQPLIRRAAVQLRLRVLLRAHQFDSYEGLVPLDPSLMSGRDCVRFTRANGFLGPILQAYNDAPRNGVSDMGSLA